MQNDDLNKVFEINTLIEYQEDAIVSRVILKKKTGNITMFAFDKGQELSEHTAPFDAVVHAVDGEFQVTLAGKEHHLNKGQMIIMPANIPHGIYATEKFKMILTMLKNQ
ncbi:MAG: cupin domain-containing protein [Calditrichaeota bacterium]|nr:cupin domain-containing protein [Calditrichota bacterium]